MGLALNQLALHTKNFGYRKKKPQLFLSLVYKHL